MGVSIDFYRPYACVADDTDAKPPLRELTAGQHVHGQLVIRVAGRELPRLGYFGPDDVCLGAWAYELQQAVAELSMANPARYVYDECEQGQPAYLFARSGDRVEVSVIDSEGDGAGSPEWGVQLCALHELVAAVDEFLAALWDRLRREARPAAREWWLGQRLAPRAEPDSAADGGGM